MLLMLSLYSASALALSDYNKTVKNIGASFNPDSQFTSYVRFNEALSTDCAFDVIYVDVTKDAGRAIYSALISAKATSMNVTRVEYTQLSAGAMCTLDSVEVGS